MVLPDLKEQFFTSGYNFNKYVDQGFLITPGDYNGEYVVVGIMECSVIPEATKDMIDENIVYTKLKDRTSYYYKYIGTNSFRIKTVNADSLISFMYKQALEWKADGIIKFAIVTEILPTYNISVPKIYGIAIRRKKV
jgi:hypothetical protein